MAHSQMRVARPPRPDGWNVRMRRVEAQAWFKRRVELQVGARSGGRPAAAGRRTRSIRSNPVHVCWRGHMGVGRGSGCMLSPHRVILVSNRS